MPNPIPNWIQIQTEKAEGKIHISEENPIEWHTTLSRESVSRNYIEQTYTTDTKNRIQITVHDEEWE